MANKIILALDVDTISEADKFLNSLGDLVNDLAYIKIGQGLIARLGGQALARQLKQSWPDLPIFADTKIWDIPEQLFDTLEAVAGWGVDSVSVAAPHFNSGLLCQELCQTIERFESKYIDVAIWPVLLLSSEDSDLLARDADNGISWFKSSYPGGALILPGKVLVATGAEIRHYDFVATGIRPDWAQSDSHKRPVTPAEAVRHGANYIVIGRPITQPPLEIGSSREALKRIVEEIEAVVVG